MTSSANANLHKAKSGKNDEFYTQLVDIEKELKHYKEHFKGKVVLCNCDDPSISNFYQYFALNFRELGLKKLITTCYKSQERDLFSKFDSEKAIWLEYDGFRVGENVPKLEDIGVKTFEGDGDFRSSESVELLKQADIVVTNPPFSLFREYVSQLVEHDKKFVIVGSLNAITYKEIFKLIKENKLWMGFGFSNGNAFFKTPHVKEFATGVFDEKSGLVKFRNVSWFTNLDNTKRHEEIVLFKKYNESEYPKYDNYDAINVDKIVDIPGDYAGAMGVPITFLDKYNPNQFEIIGIDRYVEDNPNYGKRFTIKDKEIYARILIKNKKPNI